jgi:hypothetical protein
MAAEYNPLDYSTSNSNNAKFFSLLGLYDIPPL